MRQTFSKVWQFITQDIWHTDMTDAPRIRAFGVRGAKSVLFLYHQFWEDQLLTRASALTYSSLLAIVPLLAIVFTLYQSLGLYVDLEPVLLGWLEPLGDKGELIVNKIIEFVSNAQTGALGIAGSITLLFTSLNILSTIEDSYNEIWNVKSMRSWKRRITNYLALLLLGPVFIAAIIAANASLTSDMMSGYVDRSLWYALLPYGLSSLLFALVIRTVPNTRVSLRAALIGGICSGIGWQFLNWAFASFIADASQASARDVLFAGFAALPAFLVWLYGGWVVLLLGAEVAYAIQHVVVMEWRERERRHGAALRLYVGLLAVLYIAHDFLTDSGPTSIARIIKKTGAPEPVIESLLNRCIDAGVLAHVDGKVRGYLPAAPPADIPVNAVLSALNPRYPLPELINQDEPLSLLAQQLLETEHSAAQISGEQSLAEAVKSVRPKLHITSAHMSG